MATQALQVDLLNDLKVEAGELDVGGESIHLTPYLTLACALLYMVASDGELGAEESSHLQSVLGGMKRCCVTVCTLCRRCRLTGF